jgi:hypothetical protein
MNKTNRVIDVIIDVKLKQQIVNERDTNENHSRDEKKR